MRGKRVIITISEKHFEQLQKLTNYLTPREKGKVLKLWFEHLIDQHSAVKYAVQVPTGKYNLSGVTKLIESILGKINKIAVCFPHAGKGSKN